MQTAIKIDKENISTLRFGHEEVLQSKEEIQMRLFELECSQTLGNLLQTKVQLTFQSSDGQIYEVHTTVWAVGNQFVLLKGGITIPIHSIIQID
ncbi:hypothetical protein [Algoriphagus hitonicola]|uniref:Uncharacterized protein n=1 Tax=Algoriphagus hitonicola TaxID=435880 RepID=A0A1I2NBZ6_9BACT|nr:hypothetical protein [Algoriphagus hitonicola]SFG01093.1 hypothetical protein SAMN04487988_10121 [Algoriphagus hitonicola]